MVHQTLIEPAELAAHLDDDDWAVIDCRFSLDDTERGRTEYTEAHIPGAVYAHLDDDLSGPIQSGRTGRHPLPPVPRMAETLGAWGISDDVQVVCYDDAGGAIAARLWWMLRYLGHDGAAVLNGGWTAWTAEDRPTRSGTESREPRSFVPRMRQGLAVDTERVDAIRHDASWKLLDARDAARYRGEEEPIDPVAGHIPGAVSVPFKGNLDESGRFRSSEALRDRFKDILDATAPNHIVSHCGSGVTACHNILAMEIAGISGSLLYPGSWSAWITNRHRPVATGSEETPKP